MIVLAYITPVHLRTRKLLQLFYEPLVLRLIKERARYTSDTKWRPIMETFYNESSIYVGFKLEGEALIKNEPAFEFFWDGKAIGSSGHGSFLNDQDVYTTWLLYGVMQPSEWYDFSQLPEEFTLDFIIRETSGPKRKFEFKIPMKRSDREVVKPYPRSLG